MIRCTSQARASRISFLALLALFAFGCGDDETTSSASGTSSATGGGGAGATGTGGGTTSSTGTGGATTSTTGTGGAGTGGATTGTGGAGTGGTGGDGTGGGGIGNCDDVVAGNIALQMELGCTDNSEALRMFCESLYDANKCTVEWEALHECLGPKPTSDYECDGTMGGVVDPKDGVCMTERAAFVGCLR